MMKAENEKTNSDGSPLSSLRFIDLRAHAQQQLPQGVFDYIDSAAGEERTVKRNESDLEAIQFRPLCLRNVNSPELATSILGCDIAAPIGFSPTAFHRLVHPDGEVATAKAAKELNIPMIVSSMASVSLEDVAQQSRHPHLWFQTYLFSDRGITMDLVHRTKEANYKAIVLTVGCPVPGIRYRNIRNRFMLPDGVTAANFQRNTAIVHNNPIHSFQGAELDATASWRDIEWLRQRSDLPLVVKGLMNPADVVPAIESGVSGLIVSNHGGRQLDGTESSIMALPEIIAAADGRLSVSIDSGFRSGNDVLKGLALGADAVFLGRPVMWALAKDGALGVTLAMKELIADLQISMQLLGCRSLVDLRDNSALLVRIRR